MPRITYVTASNPRSCGDFGEAAYIGTVSNGSLFICPALNDLSTHVFGTLYVNGVDLVAELAAQKAAHIVEMATVKAELEEHMATLNAALNTDIDSLQANLSSALEMLVARKVCVS